MGRGAIKHLVGLASTWHFRITPTLRHLLNAELPCLFHQLQPPIHLLESRFDHIVQVEFCSLPTMDTVPLFLLGDNVLTR